MQKNIISLFFIFSLLLMSLAPLHSATAGENVLPASPGVLPAEQPVYFPLDPLLVPLKSKDSPIHYLKITIIFEVTGQQAIPVMQSLKPRIVDSFQGYLQDLRAEDLLGSIKLDHIRADLLARTRNTGKDVPVKSVLIQEMLLQ